MEATIQLPKPHEAQRRVLNERKRRNVMCNGRRWGKNVLLQILAVETCIHGRFCGWGAPVYRQMMDDYRALENILAPVVAGKSKSEMRIEVVGGGVIDFHSLDKPDNIRGKRYHRFIVNEAAFVPSLIDVRGFIIQPTLIDFAGDEYYSGTPKGMNGFYTLYSQTGDDWARWKMSSYTNPFIPRGELDELKNIVNERVFRQEILAEFIEDGAGVFRNIRQRATASRLDSGIPGRQYVIGVDWGRVDDATVFCVLDVTDSACVHVDRMTDTDFAIQRMRLKALAERFNNAQCLVETNSIGQPQLEELQRMGVYASGFKTTNTTKAQIIDALALAYEQGAITTINDETLINELVVYTSELLGSGLVRYSAPDGMHDDCVIALALAWWAGNRLPSDKLIDYA